MRRNQSRRGFTLMEMLIVIAIIAILIAIAIPMLFSAVKRAKETACLANRTNLEHEIAYTYLEHAASFEEVTDTFDDQYIEEHGYTCPSGSELFIKYEGASGQYSVICQKHGGRDASYNLADIMSNFLKNNDSSEMKDFVERLKTRPGKKIDQIDSAVASKSPWAQVIQEQLAKATGDEIGKGMTTTWTLCNAQLDDQDEFKDNYTIYWSSQDIKTMKATDSILMMKYDAATGGYTAGIATVKINQHDDVNGGKPYNIIDPKSFKALDNIDGTDFNSADFAYSKKLKELKKAAATE